jgi:hypothetical protein
MSQRIFAVCEVDQYGYVMLPGAHGYFDNFEAAEKYISATFTDMYDRRMMISEVTLHSSWPFNNPEDWVPVQNTYFRQIDGAVVRRD